MPLKWSELPFNGVEPDDGVEPDGDDELCPVCAAPMQQRTRVLAACRHEFCFGCISREVDMRGRCPLDRLRVDRSMLERLDGVTAHAGPTTTGSVGDALREFQDALEEARGER